MSKSKKQAVLLIHGVGEQRPMDTLRGFVKAVWDDDALLHNNYVYNGKGKRWSKPDNISGSYELRCLTTSKNTEGVLTDFYEFYWAHLMEGNKISHVFSWLKRILFKAPWKLPKPLVGVWFFIMFAGLGIIYLLFNQVLPSAVQLGGTRSWTPTIIGLILIPFFLSIFRNIVGDAARYLDSSPQNIKRRQEIRAKGISILKKIHDSGKYQRIIIVGHSLGTFIAYDILSYAWQDYNNGIPAVKKFPELDKMEELINSGSTNTNTFRDLQHKVYREQLDNGGTWLVSDLITLGSPLTYADLLLAENRDELILKQLERELPTCPPQLDEKKKITYGDKRKFHYAAMFAPTRWTNIYFPPSSTIFGDIISGPLQPMFGYGIEDIPVKTKINMGLASHTNYWTLDKNRLAIDKKVMEELMEARTKDDENKEEAIRKIKTEAWGAADEADHIFQLRKALNLVDK